MRQWKPKHKPYFKVGHFWVNVIRKSHRTLDVPEYQAGVCDDVSPEYTMDIHECFKYATRAGAKAGREAIEMTAMCWYGIEPA